MSLTTAERMRRYRSRKTFERAVQWCLDNGVPAEELQDLVGFVASGVKMRFHRKGRPKGIVTSARYFGSKGQVTPVTAIPVTQFEADVKPMDLIATEKTPTIQSGRGQKSSV